MSYRTFTQPHTSAGWNSHEWSRWFIAQDDWLYIPVRPDQPHAICQVCRASVGLRADEQPWRFCYNCYRSAGTTVAGLVPVSYSWFGGLEPAIARAKDDPSHRWLAMPLGALLHRFLSAHFDCIERQYGHIDLITMLPSHRAARGGWDHLRQLWNSFAPWPRPERWNLDLLVKNHPSRADERRQQADPALFSVTSYVGRKRILLIDDTWTSGGSMYSAGAALRDAQAWPSVALTLGRQFRGNDARSTEWRNGLTPGVETDIDGVCVVHSQPTSGRIAFGSRHGS